MPADPLVDHLPTVKGIPTPKEALGYHIGAPQKLTYYADMLKYYRALEAATPRVKVETIGKSDEGRELVVVWVSLSCADAAISRAAGKAETLYANSRYRIRRADRLTEENSGAPVASVSCSRAYPIAACAICSEMMSGPAACNSGATRLVGQSSRLISNGINLGTV